MERAVEQLQDLQDDLTAPPECIVHSEQHGGGKHERPLRDLAVFFSRCASARS